MPTDPMATDWSPGTFDGARRAQARDIAALTPQQRLEWLDTALDLALASGALDRVRAERARQAEALWAAS
ncbi:MAG TPA: hypothetical protein VNA14_12410 [Mycobacteriales bacterium]|nr:hypothetical protein [Mycobacteriales bacterium]